MEITWFFFAEGRCWGRAADGCSGCMLNNVCVCVCVCVCGGGSDFEVHLARVAAKKI